MAIYVHILSEFREMFFTVSSPVPQSKKQNSVNHLCYFMFTISSNTQ